MSKKDIIEKALEVINTSGFSSYKIAQLTGITETTIGNYKNGRTQPTLANANIIISNLAKKKEDVSTIDNKKSTSSKLEISNMSVTIENLMGVINMLAKQGLENAEANKQNAEANKMHAEANKKNSSNLEKMINLLEKMAPGEESPERAQEKLEDVV